jgi:hypothetical protein
MANAYDNEAGKGDHRQVKGRETPYRFVERAHPERLCCRSLDPEGLLGVYIARRGETYRPW